MPIRLRLLLVYVVASMVLAGAGAVVFEHQLRGGLINSMDTALQARSIEVSQVIPETGPALNFQDEPERLSSPRATFAQIFDPAGNLVETSEAIGHRPLLGTADLAAARRQPGRLTVRHGYETLRLRTEPSPRSSGRWVVVVGGSLDPADNALVRVRHGLVIGIAGLLVLGAAGVWLLAGAALRPVERMRRAAAQIHVHDPAARLQVPRTRDEVARLGRTFNELLARLQESLGRQRRFVAEAGHELRSPLAVLQTELELAARPGRTCAQLAMALQNAAEETKRLSRLSANLLLLAQSDENVTLAQPRR